MTNLSGPSVAALVSDSAGNAILGVYHYDAVDLGGVLVGTPASYQLSVVKLDSSGAYLWSRSYESQTQWHSALSLGADAFGNVTVIGSFHGPIDFGGGPVSTSLKGSLFVLKLDPLGNTLWSRAGAGLIGLGLSHGRVDAAGNVFFAGSFGSGADLGTGPLTTNGVSGGLVAKLDPSGATTWVTTFAGAAQSSVTPEGVGVDGASNVFVGGSFRGTVDFGGGNFVGDPEPFEPQDGFLVKLDSAGNPLWSKHLGTLGSNDAITSLDADSSGNVVMLGWGNGGPLDFGGGPQTGRLHIAKLDGAGNLLWSQAISIPFFGVADIFGDDIAFDAAGNVLIAGSAHGDVAFGCPPLKQNQLDYAFVAALDPLGAPLWTRQYGDDASGWLVAPAPSGHVLFGGHFQGNIDLGFGAQPSQSGQGDAFLIDLGP